MHKYFGSIWEKGHYYFFSYHLLTSIYTNQDIEALVRNIPDLDIETFVGKHSTINEHRTAP